MIEHQILWKVRIVESTTWWDNWKTLGSLYHVTEIDLMWDDRFQKLITLTRQATWNVTVLNQLVPGEIVNHTLDNVQPPDRSRENDKPIWILKSNRKFTFKYA